MVRPSLIYCDPPWRFATRGTPNPDDDRAPPYSTLTLADLKHDHRPLTQPDALLAMWVIDTHLLQAFDLATAWGFTYTTMLFRWLKTTKTGKMNFSMGYYTRAGGAEDVLLFKKGKGLPVLNRSIRREFFAPVQEHSRKPPEVRDWLVDLFGDVPRLEMFARASVPGWRVHGDEIGRFRN